MGEAGPGRPRQEPPGALTTAEKDELARLRKENRELREDREKAARTVLAQHPTLFPPAAS